MVNKAKILPSRSYESPVFTVESTIKPSAIVKFNYNKQLLDEVEHDIMNYQNQGLCYLPKQIIQTRGFDNS